MIAEENENPEHLLNKLFAKAKVEQPIVDANDIKNLVLLQTSSMVSTNLFIRYKFLWFSATSMFIAAIFYFLYTNTIKKQQQIPQLTTTINQQSLPTHIKQQTAIVSNAIKENKKQLLEIPSTSQSRVEEESSTLKQDLSTIKKQDYYFPGDAKINFENEGSNVNMLIGNDLKRLEINGVVINENEYSKYNDLIQKGKALKAEADKSSSNLSESEKHQHQKNREVMDEIIKQLQGDKMIDTDGHFEFRLTGTKLFINTIPQNEAMFAQYKALYENVSGYRLNEKSNIKIKH